jgi:hypothetical protein
VTGISGGPVGFATGTALVDFTFTEIPLEDPDPWKRCASAGIAAGR